MEIDLKSLYNEVYDILDKGYKNTYPSRGKIRVNPDKFQVKTPFELGLSKEDLLKVILYTSIKRPSIYEKMILRDYIDFETYLEVLEKNFDTIEFCPASYYDNKESLKKILEIIIKNKERVNYDALPESVAQMEEVKNAFDRDKQIYTIKRKSSSDSDARYDRKGYDIEWNDKEGNLIKFFSLPGKFKINSKDDYIKLIEEYKQSNLSVPAFCRKYYITDVDGFKNLIERLKKEKVSEEKELSEHSSKASKAFWEQNKKIANNILEGKITIEDWIKNYYNPFQTISLLVSTITDDKRVKFLNMIADQTTDYIMAHENEIEVEKLSTLYSADYKFRINGQSKLAIQMWKFLREKSSTPVNYALVKKACNIISLYSAKFTKNDIPTAVTYSGVRYDITKEQADQVFAYLDYRNLVCCPKTFNYHLKEILTGQLDFSEQTKNARKQMLENIVMLSEQLNERATVDKYLETVRR